MKRLKALFANEKVRSVLKGAALAAGGALVAYGGDLVKSGVFGPHGALVGALASVALNAIRKALAPGAKP